MAKHLICIGLYGGLSGWSAFPPFYDYAKLQSFRPDIALPRSQLLQLTSEQGMHPGLSALLPAYSDGKVAVIRNIGALDAPLTKQQYLDKVGQQTPGVEDHAKMINNMQTDYSERPTDGVGGRIGDWVMHLNRHPQLTCINVSEQASYLEGKRARQYSIGTGGATPLWCGSNGVFGGDGPAYEALIRLITKPRTDLFDKEQALTAKRMIETSAVLRDALARAPKLKTVFPATRPGAQVKQIVNMMAIAPDLGQQAVVYHMSLGGFDTHDSERSTMAVLLPQVGTALAALIEGAKEIGAWDDTFAHLIADFGRAAEQNKAGLTSGSDHGWANTLLAFGGKVKGGVYGPQIEIALDGVHTYGRGRQFPSLPSDFLHDEAVKHFGLSAQRDDILINRKNFAGPGLDLLAA